MCTLLIITSTLHFPETVSTNICIQLPLDVFFLHPHSHHIFLAPNGYKISKLIIHMFALFYFLPASSPSLSLRQAAILTRSRSMVKGTLPVRCLKQLRTVPLCWRSSTGGRFTPAESWVVGGSSMSIQTTKAASTCWRKASTASLWTGVPSVPLCSLLED